MADSDVPENKGWKGPYRGDFLSLAPLRPLLTPMATSVEAAEAYTVTRRPTGIAQGTLAHGRFSNFTGVMRTSRAVSARRPAPPPPVSALGSEGVPIPENPWDSDDDSVEPSTFDSRPASVAPVLPARTPTPRPASWGTRPSAPRGAAPRSGCCAPPGDPAARDRRRRRGGHKRRACRHAQRGRPPGNSSQWSSPGRRGR